MRLFKRGNIWWVSDGRHGDKCIRKSTGKTDRAEAETVAKMMLAPLALSKDAESVRQISTFIEDRLRKDAAKIIGASTSLEAAWQYYPTKTPDGRSKAESTIRNARSAWNVFISGAGAEGIVSIGELTQTVCDKILAALKPRWRQIVYRTASQIFRAMSIPSPLGIAPRHPQSEVQHREALTREQISTLLNTAVRATQRNNGRGICPEYPLFLKLVMSEFW